ncbi:type VI secretion system contractile sheath large subunit [Caballeronia jiangsuensis]|uniref:Type VI secretion system contractile sheath large subunit n=1 Tax=Caballeronia jiangsuensis TaxID=1458357 RepID=A0ABW9CU78_9BURK
MHYPGEERDRASEVNEIYRLFEKETGLGEDADGYDPPRYREYLHTAASQALESGLAVPGDARRTLESLIYELDAKLTEQLNEIMHHPDFRRLEAAWRGLWYVCSRTEPVLEVKLKVLNASKRDVYRMTKSRRYSPLYDMVYRDGLATFGGEPFGAIIVDFQFDSGGSDLEILHHLASLGAKAHAVFVTNAAPAMFGLANFDEIHAARDLRVERFSPERGGWDGLRQKAESRYLCIALPRLMLRAAYGKRQAPCAEFDFEEDLLGKSNVLWGNAAWAVGDAIVKSFDQDGWFAALCGSEAPGKTDDLPAQIVYTDDGEQEVVGPIETSVSYARERELMQSGFTVLLQRKGHAEFVINAVLSPYRRESIDPTGRRRDAKTPERDLRTLLCASRFVHHIPAVWNLAPARPSIDAGGAQPRPFDSLARSVQNWLDGYVATDGAAPTPLRPLRDAIVHVQVSEADSRDQGVDIVLAVWLGYLFDGDVGPIEITMRLENVFDRPPARDVPATQPADARSTDARPEHAGAIDDATYGGDPARPPPFELRAIGPSAEPARVIEIFARALREHAWILQHIVLGPLRVHARVAAQLPLEELADFAVSDEADLGIDMTHCVAGALTVSSSLTFLAAYPSQVVRGLSAALLMHDDRFALKLLDPLAVLDPGEYIPVPVPRPIESHFDIVVIRRPPNEH